MNGRTLFTLRSCYAVLIPRSLQMDYATNNLLNWNKQSKPVKCKGSFGQGYPTKKLSGQIINDLRIYYGNIYPVWMDGFI